MGQREQRAGDEEPDGDLGFDGLQLDLGGQKFEALAGDDATGDVLIGTRASADGGGSGRKLAFVAAGGGQPAVLDVVDPDAGFPEVIAFGGGAVTLFQAGVNDLVFWSLDSTGVNEIVRAAGAGDITADGFMGQNGQLLATAQNTTYACDRDACDGLAEVVALHLFLAAGPETSASRWACPVGVVEGRGGCS